MNVKLSRFSNSVLGSLANSTITISHKPAYTVVDNHVLLQKVEKDYTDFFAVFGKDTFSGMGNSVAEADTYRSQPFRGIKSILKGFTKIPDFPHYKDANDLLNILEHQGSELHLLDYGSTNERMDKLITEFDKDENKAKLSRLNLSKMYNTLKSRNAEFKKMYFKQTEANAELRMQSSATALRNNLTESLRNYFALVTAVKSIDGWSALYTELSEAIKAANNTISGPDDTKEEETKN